MYHAGIVIYRMQLGILKEGREVDHIEEMIRLLKNTLAYRLYDLVFFNLDMLFGGIVTQCPSAFHDDAIKGCEGGCTFRPGHKRRELRRHLF